MTSLDLSKEWNYVFDEWIGICTQGERPPTKEEIALATEYANAAWDRLKPQFRRNK